jgi:hypothetical protein
MLLKGKKQVFLKIKENTSQRNVLGSIYKDIQECWTLPEGKSGRRLGWDIISALQR